MPEKFKESDNIGTSRRVTEYIRNRDILLGNHWDILENPLKPDPTKSSAMGHRDLERRVKRSEIIYIAVNVAFLISKVAADFLFLEPLDLTALDKDGKAATDSPDQEKLDDIWSRNRLQTNLYESALTNSAKGDSIWKVNRIDGKAEIVEMRPELWIPEIGRNRDDFTAHNFLYPFKKSGTTQWYCHVERHTPGKVTNAVYKVKNAKTTKVGNVKDGQEVMVITNGFDLEDQPIALDSFSDYIGSLPEEVDTKLEFMPVVHIPNIRISDSTFGLSDYNDLKDLFTELNARISQVSRILDKHADPKMAGPKGLLDENGEIDRGTLELVEVDKDDVLPQYITWESALEHAFSQIDKVLDLVLMLSETSKAAFGMVQGGTSKTLVSGAALKMMLIRTLAKVARKRQYYNSGLTSLLRMSLMVEGVKDPKINIEWPSGLPEFVQETINQELDKFGEGAQSLKTTIENLNPEWDDERVEEEVDRIREDGDIGGLIGNGLKNLVRNTKKDEGSDDEGDPEDDLPEGEDGNKVD